MKCSFDVCFRFPNVGLVASFAVLALRPISFLNQNELDDWGNDDLEVILRQYGEPKCHRNGAKADALVDPVASRTEWGRLKAQVVTQKYE